MNDRAKPEKEERRVFGLPPMSRGMQVFSMLMFFLLGLAIAAFVVGNPLGVSFLPQGHKPTESAGSDDMATKPAAESGREISVLQGSTLRLAIGITNS